MQQATGIPLQKTTHHCVNSSKCYTKCYRFTPINPVNRSVPAENRCCHSVLLLAIARNVWWPETPAK